MKWVSRALIFFHVLNLSPILSHNSSSFNIAFGMVIWHLNIKQSLTYYSSLLAIQRSLCGSIPKTYTSAVLVHEIVAKMPRPIHRWVFFYSVLIIVLKGKVFCCYCGMRIIIHFVNDALWFWLYVFNTFSFWPYVRAEPDDSIFETVLKCARLRF